MSKHGDEIPIYDTATPIISPDREVIGSVVMFQDNTDQVLALVDLWEERNHELESFQLKFISQLQQATAQHQQAMACIQVLSQVLKQVRTATSEAEMLQFTLNALGTTIDADYGWISMHDQPIAMAKILCEYTITGVTTPISLIDREIDIQLYPQFYQHLAQSENWIDPPNEILPELYLKRSIPGSNLLICGIVIEAENSDQSKNWMIGEVGIVSTGKPTWMPAQTALITQIFSYAVKLFRQTNSNQATVQESMDLSWEWLNTLNYDFTDALDRADQDLQMSAITLQNQIQSLNAKINDPSALEHHQYLHRQLLEYLEIVKAEWRQQFNLIDTLIEFESLIVPPQCIAINDLEFERWLDQIIGKCSVLAQQYHQKLSSKITGHLPTILLCNLLVLKFILVEVCTNACRYTPPDQSISIDADIQANKLTLSIISTGIQIPPQELATIFLPFSHISHHHSSQHTVTGWGLELVAKLLSYLGGEIHAKSGRGCTSLILTIAI